MGNYAIIDDNIVINIATAENPVNDKWIFTGELPVAIGDTWNGKDFYHDNEKVRTKEEELSTIISILCGGINFKGK